MHVCVDHVCSIVLLSACSRRYCTPSAPYTSCINAMPPTPTIAIRVVRPSAFDRPILVTCMATALIQHRVPPTRKDSNKHLAILDSRGTVRNYSVARWVVQQPSTQSLPTRNGIVVAISVCSRPSRSGRKGRQYGGNPTGASRRISMQTEGQVVTSTGLPSTVQTSLHWTRVSSATVVFFTHVFAIWPASP